MGKPKMKTFACYGTTLRVRARTLKSAKAKFSAYLVGQVKQVPSHRSDRGMIISRADIKAHAVAGRRSLQRRT